MKGQPDVNHARLFALFRDLVDLYSPSNKEEDLTRFLAGWLAEQGLPVRRERVAAGRDNLIVAGGAAPSTLLLGHVDTVPAFDMDHAGFTERDGVCSGLGAADMKGGCAALIEAVLAVQAAGGLPEDVMLALVVGEEETGDGTQALLARHRFAQALVAEPTSLRPGLQHYGYVEMEVRTFGFRRHAAVAGRESNAIRAMLCFLQAAGEQLERGEPDTVFNIRDLHSSESGFAVPDRCSVHIDLHMPPPQSATACAGRLRAMAEPLLAAGPASGHELEFPTLADGFGTDADHPLVRRLEAAFRAQGLPWKPAAFTSHSDANLLNEAGCACIMLGPGDLAKAHTREESVEFAQVVAAASLYSRLLADMA